MINSRVATLSLALVVAAFALGYANPAFAGKNKNCDPEKGDVHPSCKPPDDPEPPAGGIVYTVELTGAFEFTRDMTLNSKGNQLRSDSDVKLIRPGGDVIPDGQTACGRTDDKKSTNDMCLLWNEVFEKCPLFFEPTPVDVPGFMAPAGRKGWRIDKAGGVRVNFGDIPFPQDDFGGFLIPVSAWVNLALIGDIDFGVAFPPLGGIDLKYFQIYGQTESGVTPRLACDVANFETVDLRRFITLTITGPN